MFEIEGRKAAKPSILRLETRHSMIGMKSFMKTSYKRNELSLNMLAALDCAHLAHGFGNDAHRLDRFAAELALLLRVRLPRNPSTIAKT